MMHGNRQRLWPRPRVPLLLACSWLQSGWQVDGDGLDCTGPGWAGKTDGTHRIPSLPIHAVFGAVKVKNGAPAVERASGRCRGKSSGGVSGSSRHNEFAGKARSSDHPIVVISMQRTQTARGRVCV